jgi:ketosteroid isomerase-like protein
MSQENVELVKLAQPTGVDLVELLPNEGDDSQAALTAFPDVFLDDFVIEFVSSGWLAQREYRGTDGFVEGWRDWLMPWASYRIDVEDFIDAGDDVVVFARIRGRTARDGVLVEHSPAAVWAIRNGKVAAIRFYLERREALEAVGLSEQDARAES